MIRIRDFRQAHRWIFDSWGYCRDTWRGKLNRKLSTDNRPAIMEVHPAYPEQADEMNLCTILHLAKVFGVPADLSDHTLGVAVPVVAIT